MKKTILIVLLIIITYMVIGNVFTNKIVIPKEAIRVRVVANSNSNYDQTIKLKVKELLKIKLKDLVSDTDNINTFRKKITNNLSIFSNEIKNILDENNYNLPLNINYGLNYFPEKTFKGVTYNDGYYESLVVTLGDGLGENWWCVLFPPLCLIEATEGDSIEYTTLVNEILNKYFLN